MSGTNNWKNGEGMIPNMVVGNEDPYRVAKVMMGSLYGSVVEKIAAEGESKSEKKPTKRRSRKKEDGKNE